MTAPCNSRNGGKKPPPDPIGAMKPRLLLGVIGHVDHGKTALVRALTGMETDRLPEEKRRGISIALGFAHLALSGAVADLIDMPGHERFVRTMISGATGIDAVLLVVSAAEGIKPQTREHVDIAGLLGVRQAVVAVSKTDLVSPAQARSVGREAAALARAAGMTVGPPVLTSAVTGAGLDGVRDAIGAVLLSASDMSEVGFPYLPIDRAFSLAGHGTVVTGTLRRGSISVGNELVAIPSGETVRVRGLQVHGTSVATASPGQRVAVNLRGTELTSVPRGSALSLGGLLGPSAWISVQLRSVTTAPVLPTGALLRCLFGTEEMESRLRLLDRDALQPGDTAPAQLHCASPVWVPARETFILRQLSPPATVAGGVVLDPETVRHRRHAPGVLARLHALATATAADIVQQETERAGEAGIALTRLARIAGVAPARAAALLPGAVLLRGQAVMPEALDAVAARLPRALQAHPDGLSREALGRLLPGVGAAVLDEAATRLARSGVLRQERGLIRVYQATRERSQADADTALAIVMMDALRKAGLTPPDPGTLAPDPRAKRLLDRLVREGAVVRTTDRVQKRDIFFHPDAVEAARRRLAPLLTEPGLLVKEAGEALGISRKFSVPLLEHLDAIRFTRRVADRRVLAQMG
jgi:selenocysteine-specific elongation factor